MKFCCTRKKSKMSHNYMQLDVVHQQMVCSFKTALEIFDEKPQFINKHIFRKISLIIIPLSKQEAVHRGKCVEEDDYDVIPPTHLKLSFYGDARRSDCRSFKHRN